jgi:uncharacterized protein (TIRG00374 family)
MVRLLHKLRLTPLSFGIATATLVLLVAGVIWSTSLIADLRKEHPSWWVFGLAAAAASLQYVGYAIALRAASDPHPPFPQTLELEVAEAITTVVTPESIGSMALSMRFLTRHGLSTPDAAAAAGLNSFVTTFVAAFFVPLGAIFAASSLNITALKKDVPSSQWLIIAGIIIVAGVVTLLVKLPKLRKDAAGWIRTMGGYLRSVITQPRRSLVMALGEIITATGQVLCMSFVLLAIGAPIHIAAILVIVQIAGAASNVVPIPGGLGAPEAILVAGLSSVGVSHDGALVAAVTYRILMYWGPPVPGMVALWHLHRRDEV